MRRSILAVMFATATLTGMYIGPASAVDEHAPHGGDGSHTHHVHKGNGECEDIDEVAFEGGHRGMHRAANESGPDKGPYHGTCADHQA